MQRATTEVRSYSYDTVGRLASARATGALAGTNYHYSDSYGQGGDLATRVSLNPEPDLTRTYAYDTDSDPHAHALASVTGAGLTASFGNDKNGNMTVRTVNGTTYTQTFDAENRLTSVVVGGQATTFYYDANGQRVLTIQPNGTKLYTPFPEFEEEVPTSGATTKRSHYFLNGPLMAVRVAVTGGSNILYFTYADHLGSVTALTNTSGVYITSSMARYEPFGGYRTQPVAGVNPGITDRGFTGHKGKNTGTYNLDLIYMNTRYYLPEIGRFIFPMGMASAKST